MLVFWFDAGSNLDARTDALGQQSGTFDITQVQLEEGSVATDFEYRSIGEELALCQRYFCKSYDYNVAPGTSDFTGYVYEHQTRNHDNGTWGVNFIVEMRTNPTVILYSPSTGTSGRISNNGDKVASGGDIGTKRIGDVLITGGSAAHGSYYHYTADAEL